MIKLMITDNETSDYYYDVVILSFKVLICKYFILKQLINN